MEKWWVEKFSSLRVRQEGDPQYHLRKSTSDSEHRPGLVLRGAPSTLRAMSTPPFWKGVMSTKNIVYLGCNIYK